MLILVACEKTIGILAEKTEVMCMRVWLISPAQSAEAGSTHLSLSAAAGGTGSHLALDPTHTHTHIKKGNFIQASSSGWKLALQVREEKVKRKCSIYPEVLFDVNLLTISMQCGSHPLYMYGGTISFKSMSTRPITTPKADHKIRKQCHPSLNSRVHIHT